jgi:photosystem II stability/assembly factor-like uncharacterized protein
MKTVTAILSLTVIFFIVGCKKGEDSQGPTPPAIIKPDTISVGWKKMVLDTSIFYSDIFFSSNNIGYLAGDKAYKTVDGGLNWTAISTKGDFGNIAATSNGNAFFSRGIDDSVYKYINGGAAVSATLIPGAGYGMDVFFTDNNNGYFVTSKGLHVTTDGGINWSKINTTGIGFTFGYTSEYFVNNNTGWIVNQYGIFKTNGTASNWSQASFTGTQPTGEFNVVHATANNTVYASTVAGELYKSVDGGASFSQIKIFPFVNQEHCDIHFTDNNTGYVCAGRRIYKTTDAGANWTVVVAMGEAHLIELHFTDATHGWACGNKGVVLIFN